MLQASGLRSPAHRVRYLGVCVGLCPFAMRGR
jgi:hypothetical protein